jgi:hypothetical protein
MRINLTVRDDEAAPASINAQHMQTLSELSSLHQGILSAKQFKEHANQQQIQNTVQQRALMACVGAR